MLYPGSRLDYPVRPLARRLLLELGIALAILAYLILLRGVFLAGRVSGSFGTVLSLIAGTMILVGAWAWLLMKARAAPTPSARVRPLVAAFLIVLLLFGLACLPNLGTIVIPALVLTVPLTIVPFLPDWRLAIAVCVLPLFPAGYGYFGAVLVAIGLASAPARLGPWQRELFPRRVGGDR